MVGVTGSIPVAPTKLHHDALRVGINRARNPDEIRHACHPEPRRGTVAVGFFVSRLLSRQAILYSRSRAYSPTDSAQSWQTLKTPLPCGFFVICRPHASNVGHLQPIHFGVVGHLQPIHFWGGKFTYRSWKGPRCILARVATAGMFAMLHKLGTAFCRSASHALSAVATALALLTASTGIGAATTADTIIINYGPVTALTITISGASLGSTSTVDFKVVDQDGSGFVGLPVSALQFTVAQLQPGMTVLVERAELYQRARNARRWGRDRYATRRAGQNGLRREARQSR